MQHKNSAWCNWNASIVTATSKTEWKPNYLPKVEKNPAPRTTAQECEYTSPKILKAVSTTT